MGSKREVGLDPRGPLDYMGPDVALMTISQNDRAPTTTDTHYPLSHHWRIDSSAIAPAVEGDMWFLAKFEANGDADWQKIASGATPGGTVITLSDGTTAVNPDITGNIALTAAVGSGLTITSAPGTNSLAFDLIGVGNAITQIGVDAATAPGTNPVLPTSGLVTVQGSVVAAHSIPIRSDSLAANAMNIELQEASAVAATDATKSGISHYDINDFSVDANGFTALKNGAMVENLGMTYDSATGIFKICGYAGSTLSSTNAAYVRVGDVDLTGTLYTQYFKRYKVTDNVQFVDDTGASDIVGNSFQTGGSLWVAPMPYYVYAVQNAAKTAVAFSLCRLPHLKFAPAAAKCAVMGSAVANTQYSMFFLSKVGTPTDVTLFAGQNCVCIGSIRMSKTSAAHDWTVSAIAAYDGIGKFKEGFWAYQPLSTNGCGTVLPPADSLFLDEAGVADTAPKHVNVFLYTIGLDGHCSVQIALPVTVLGAGLNPLIACQPFEYCTAGSLDVNSSAMFKAFAGNLQTEYFPYLSIPYITFSKGKGTTDSLTNATMTAGSQLFTLFRFPIFSNNLAGGSF